MLSSLLACTAFIKFTQFMQFLQELIWPCLKPSFHLDCKQNFLIIKWFLKKLKQFLASVKSANDKIRRTH